MSLKERIKQLEAEAEARRRVRECICSQLVIMDHEPTQSQQQALDAVKTCPVHPAVVTMVEVGRSQVSRTMEVQDALEFEN
jgi:hypothetical protein